MAGQLVEMNLVLRGMQCNAPARPDRLGFSFPQNQPNYLVNLDLALPQILRVVLREGIVAGKIDGHRCNEHGSFQWMCLVGMVAENTR
jgi:hypothetical protein